jgi:hypothetical protein
METHVWFHIDTDGKRLESSTSRSSELASPKLGHERTVVKADYIVLASCAGLVWWMAGFDSPFFADIERKFARFAAHRWLSLAAIGAATILIRLALLAWAPVPQPKTHDEFGYLLASDTFSHARLANPPHPLWVFFDTFHVIGRPSYASIYPPAPGAFLALGKLVGSPWIGVLLGTAAMCVALTWMLQSWMPSRWALFGGMLVVLRFGIFSYWMNSFWGGSVSATGAALVMGAFPSIVKTRRVRDALVFGTGIVILATSRPVEGFVYCMPLAVALVYGCLSGWNHQQNKRDVNILLTLASVLGCLVGFMAYYNWRLTNNPILFPHFIEDRGFVTTPAFLWEHSKPPLKYANRQFEAFYNNWMPSLYQTSWSGAKKNIRETVTQFWKFFLGPAFTIPFLTLPWLVRDRKMRLPLIQFGLSSIGLLAIVWFHPHYAAPLLATLVLLILQAMRHLRTWRCYGRRVGVELLRLIAVFCILIAPASFLIARSPGFFKFWLPSVEWLPPRYTLALLAVLLVLALLVVKKRSEPMPADGQFMRLEYWDVLVLILFVWLVCIEQGVAHARNFPQDATDLSSPRALIEQRLNSLPGEHLVLVRYSPIHNVHMEYVYNGADIDHSKTVWARDIQSQELRLLLSYFRNRDVWVLEPDEKPQRLYPYSQSEQQ